MVVGDGPAADEALSLLRQADDALRDGDLGRYQQLVEAALGVLSQAADDEASGANDAETEADADTTEDEGDG